MKCDTISTKMIIIHYIVRTSKRYIILSSATAKSKRMTLQWRHNGRDSVSNHQPHCCLLNRLFRRRSKKTSKLRVTGLCVGNSPGTGESAAQMAINAENVSIWWRHHGDITTTDGGSRGIPRSDIINISCGMQSSVTVAIEGLFIKLFFNLFCIYIYIHY